MLVRESLYFEKGQEPKQAMSIGLVSVRAECGDLEIKDDRIDVDAGESSFEFNQYLEEHGIQYEFLGFTSDFQHLPTLRFTSTRNEIIEFLMIFFNPGAESESIIRRKLRLLFRTWNEKRDEDKLWDILS